MEAGRDSEGAGGRGDAERARRGSNWCERRLIDAVAGDSTQPTVSGVLFDLDDTLNDRSRSWMVFVERMVDPAHGYLRECVVPEIHQRILVADQGGYRPKAELFADLELLPWKEPLAANQIEAIWRERFPGCMVTRHGVYDLLIRLRQLDIRTGIVTNGRADAQHAKISKMGLDGAVDLIVTSGGVGFKKPDHRIFEIALDRLGIDARDAFFVGDNPHSDIRGASQVGMRTVWLANGRHWELSGFRPNHIISTFEGVNEVLSMLDHRWA